MFCIFVNEDKQLGKLKMLFKDKVTSRKGVGMVWILFFLDDP